MSDSYEKEAIRLMIVCFQKSRLKYREEKKLLTMIVFAHRLRISR